MDMETINNKVEAARMAGGATLVTIWGITLNEWAAIAAIAYTVFQMIILWPKVVSTVKGWFCVNPE